MADSTFAIDGAFSLPPIPILRTARLSLREPRLSDFDAFASEGEDPVASRYLGGTTDRFKMWRGFLAGVGGWAMHGLGRWTVEERETGADVGAVGLFRRELPQLEIGWRIHRAKWGRGYALEAARAAIDYTKQTLSNERVIAHIAKDNVQSIRVAEKLGMKREGEVLFLGSVDWLYVL